MLFQGSNLVAIVCSFHPAQTALKGLISLQHFTVLLDDPTSLGLKQLF